MSQKILVVVGSPRVGGNTDQLADAFMRGLRENNHSVKKIHLAKVKVNPCLGCEQCFRNGTPCVQKDDMNDILKDVEQADLIVFACPVYFSNLTAQMKMFIDRFYCMYHQYHAFSKKETMLLMTAGGPVPTSFQTSMDYFDYTVVNFMGWKDRGKILVGGVHDKNDIQNTDGLEKAYAFGKTIV
ncbi:MAG TPA: flavodoxin family protein [Firmicutes bacterium]|nr:flavodoxin family protein [Bacillota bacterium]